MAKMPAGISTRNAFVFGEDVDAADLNIIKEACGAAFESPPASGQLYGELARRIRSDVDKALGGRGWNVIVGRSFGAYVTHRIKAYAYLSVFPGVNILVWKA